YHMSAGENSQRPIGSRIFLPEYECDDWLAEKPKRQCRRQRQKKISACADSRQALKLLVIVGIVKACEVRLGELIDGRYTQGNQHGAACRNTVDAYSRCGLEQPQDYQVNVPVELIHSRNQRKRHNGLEPCPAM